MRNTTRNDVTGKPIFNKSEGAGEIAKYQSGYDAIDWGHGKPSELTPTDDTCIMQPDDAPPSQD